MEVLKVCESYFSVFQELSNFKSSDAKTNALAMLKLFSLLTVVVPLGFGIVYGIATLVGRIKKKETFSKTDEKMMDVENNSLYRMPEDEILKAFENDKCVQAAFKMKESEYTSSSECLKYLQEAKQKFRGQLTAIHHNQFKGERSEALSLVKDNYRMAWHIAQSRWSKFLNEQKWNDFAKVLSENR